jgi:hypothetical protein
MVEIKELVTPPKSKSQGRYQGRSQDKYQGRSNKQGKKKHKNGY